MLWPEDQFQLFDVQETRVAVGAGAIGKIASLDSMRVALVICCDGQGLLSTSATAVAGQGIRLDAGTMTSFQAFHRQSGTLCQQEWYGNQKGVLPAVNYTVITVSLARHPDETAG